MMAKGCIQQSGGSTSSSCLRGQGMDCRSKASLHASNWYPNPLQEAPDARQQCHLCLRDAKSERAHCKGKKVEVPEKERTDAIVASFRAEPDASLRPRSLSSSPFHLTCLSNIPFHLIRN